jgi:bifunctional non-homologous end joining protein LigD
MTEGQDGAAREIPRDRFHQGPHRRRRAFYLGKQEGNELVYVGKVGPGWSRTISSQIRKQLDTVVSPKSKLTKPVRKPKATWVEPKFLADVEYRDITSEGLLRASSFKGLSRK